MAQLHNSTNHIESLVNESAKRFHKAIVWSLEPVANHPSVFVFSASPFISDISLTSTAAALSAIGTACVFKNSIA